MPNKPQIPIPPEAFRNRWDFHNLAVGDSIWVEWPRRRRLRAAAVGYASTHPDFRWVSMKMPHPDNPAVTGVRLWRIEQSPGHP